ncbi:amidohydrolase family protein [Frankia sp. CNm7]|uniref:Amidohydrolase family protein n=1 Tax=Frankia nepalensis TaxID=1836974 RepID=A0A937RKH0_9ACTN|nr:amidohydrolase family protein [Frankia nepalensis]MBL7502067.1 amidohydrolase family protein [Frankia nepalensis]MBL7511801.1 amidohydrolase family protein [Frankia nepalensis]MBL7524654.1 amidohydrolase family protein [Frankia nepalensis]MBL7630565.1 amidohydrolase family protein [Frankia nepalensis]
MAPNFDHVIRNGTIADGSGGELFEGDVAIRDGRIVAVGRVEGAGDVETDARDKLVTPGFVDIHTHYDGQITWEHRLSPSSSHGVTTAVMGNCGVGFAPCSPHHRELLVKVLEGVEDIPEIVMAEGLPWTWETYPEYLSVLADRAADMDFASQLPHAAVRVHVMGERGANREAPTPGDLDEMTRIVAEAVTAGAMGVSTSRSIGHRTPEGDLAPTVGADEAELHALARGLRQAGAGVLQLIGSQGAHDPLAEVALFRRLTMTSGGPLSFSLMSSQHFPDHHQRYLDALAAQDRDGLPPIRGQVFPRPVGVVLGLDFSFHPFVFNPSYQQIGDLPLPERVEAMRAPDRRARILSERPEHPNPVFQYFASQDAALYLMAEVPDYEPTPDRTMGALAAARGITPRELIYDTIVDSGGLAAFLLPATNYQSDSLEPVRLLLRDPHTVVGLGDGGAHYGTISDGSYPTTLLTHWTRDRTRGPRIPVQEAVRLLTRPNAETVGLRDRGLLAPGFKADLNVIDYDALRLHRPVAVRDLPAGGRRLVQKAEGYALTMVSGAVTYRDGEPTGALPGRLVRNPATAAHRA